MTAIREATVDAVRDDLDAYRVIDVREAHEFQGPLGHVEGAAFHPLGTLPEALSGSDTGERLLLVCRSGKRSLRACELLQEAGFADVTNLEGGMIAWNQASFPVERAEFATIRDVIANVVAYLAHVTPATLEVVTDSISLLLEEAGSSYEEPSYAAAAWALQELAEGARHPKPPADLDLVVAVYRRDLAVL